MLFDSHCHLADEKLASDWDAVLHRARDADVGAILNVADTLESAAFIQQQLKNNSYGIEIYATAGVHPQRATEWNDDSSAQLNELLNGERIVAVGEIGLDWFYDETHPEHPGATRERQLQVLAAQLTIARERDLPVVLHNRDADRELLNAIEQFPSVRGVFHCFGGDQEMAQQVLARGFYLGFGGITTFKNAQQVREVVAWCPIERLLIETDAPYLAPVPKRGKTNEPAFIAYTAQFVAELRGMSVDELGAQTARNAQQLFGLAFS